MRKTLITIVVSAATLLTLTSCTNTSTDLGETPEESAYLNASYRYFESIDRTWTTDTSDIILKFGYDICEDMSKYPNNTREQNVLGTQASVRLSDQPEDTETVLVEEVQLASDYLCPAP